MTNRRALLVGSVARLKSFAGVLASQHFEVEQPAKNSWPAVFKLTAKGHYDLLLVDLNLPGTGIELVEQLQKRGGVPVVIVGDEERFKRHRKELEPLLAQPDVDWVTTPVGDVEFGWRVNKVAPPREAQRLATWSVPELRSDESGRLDAARVAEHFGWTVAELSRALGRSVQAVHKTPDAPAMQKRLEKLERAALLARRLVSQDPSELRKWLNTPSPDLDEEKPGKLLLERPSVVVEWLEDAASGHPA